MAEVNFDQIRALDDFLYFAECGLRYHDEYRMPFAKFHYEIPEIIFPNRYVLMEWPRGHLKSTLMSIWYPLWRSWREKSYEVELASSALDQSTINIRKIQLYAETTPWLKHLVPKTQDYNWNSSQAYFTNGNKVWIKAFNSSARGTHPNEIIMDDILRDPKDTPPEEISNTYWSVFYPKGPSKKCRNIIIGTPMSDTDLFAEIIEKNQSMKQWKVVVKSAVVTGSDGEWVKPLWPEMFTLEELKMRQQLMGQYRFASEMMCSPTVRGGSFYPNIAMASDDFLTFSRKVTGNIYVGVDHATSSSPTGDYVVFIVVEHFPGIYRKRIQKDSGMVEFEIKNPAIIKDIRRFKAGTPKYVAAEIQNLYHPVIFTVDKSGAGQGLIKDMRALGLNVEEQDFQPMARNSILVNMRRFFETDEEVNPCPRVVIPTSQNDHTWNETQVLVEELAKMQEGKTTNGSMTIHSVGKHDDTVMALAMALKNIPLDEGNSALTIITADYFGNPVLPSTGPRPHSEGEMSVNPASDNIPTGRFKIDLSPRQVDNPEDEMKRKFARYR